MAFDMYQEKILLHYRNPRNFGEMVAPDRAGEESNPLCGDHITMELKLDGAHQRIAEVKFHGDGCAISIASASMLTERLKGLDLPAAEAIQRDDVIQMLGIPLSPVRIKCALTSFVALGRALGSTSANSDVDASAPAEGAAGP